MPRLPRSFDQYCRKPGSESSRTSRFVWTAIFGRLGLKFSPAGQRPQPICALTFKLWAPRTSPTGYILRTSVGHICQFPTPWSPLLRTRTLRMLVVHSIWTYGNPYVLLASVVHSMSLLFTNILPTHTIQKIFNTIWPRLDLQMWAVR